MEGYIKIHRKITESWVWKEPDKAVCLFYGNADLSGQARELSMRQTTTAPESEKEDAGI